MNKISGIYGHYYGNNLSKIGVLKTSNKILTTSTSGE